MRVAFQPGKEPPDGRLLASSLDGSQVGLGPRSEVLSLLLVLGGRRHGCRRRQGGLRPTAHGPRRSPGGAALRGGAALLLGQATTLET